MEKKYLNNRLMNKFCFQDCFRSNIFLANVHLMPIHMHDGIELLSVIKGSISIKIGFDDYLLHAGDFLMINPYEVHSIESRCDYNEIIIMEIDKSLFGGKLYVFDIDFYRNVKYNKANEVKALMSSVLRLGAKNKEGDGILAKEMVKEIIGICDENFQMQAYVVNSQSESSFASNSLNNERIKKAYEYLYIEVNQKKKLVDLAGMVNVDKCYASRIIKTGIGESFQDILKIVRVDRAEVFLLGTDLSIQKISEILNFHSTDHFRKIFKQYYGISPLAYRNGYKGRTYPDSPMDYEIINVKAKGTFNVLDMMELIEQLQSTLLKDITRTIEMDGCTVTFDEANKSMTIRNHSGEYSLVIGRN